MTNKRRIIRNDVMDTVTYVKKCSVTGKDYSVTVERQKVYEWHDKKQLIQNVFPELTAEEREFMVSGATPEEWNKLMSL